MAQFKKARGQVRKMLISFGKIQSWAGSSRAHHENDRDNYGWEKGQDLLNQIFEECLRIRNEYEIVEEAHD